MLERFLIRTGNCNLQPLRLDWREGNLPVAKVQLQEMIPEFGGILQLLESVTETLVIEFGKFLAGLMNLRQTFVGQFNGFLLLPLGSRNKIFVWPEERFREFRLLRIPFTQCMVPKSVVTERNSCQHVVIVN